MTKHEPTVDMKRHFVELMERFNHGFEEWKKLAYKDGADPQGQALAKFVNEFRKAFHDNMGEMATSNQMVVMFAYLQATTSAPNLLGLTEKSLAQIASQQGELFTLAFLEMVKVHCAALRNKSKPNLITIPKA